MFAVIKIVSFIDETFKIPEDWGQLMKLIQKKDKKIADVIENIPSSIEVLEQERSQILKMKTQCFGKGKISLTTISSGYQKESRAFANLFALIVMVLQKLKRDKSSNDVTNITNFTPLKNQDKKNLDIDASSTNNEVESVLPKESCDDGNSYYYRGSKYTPSSAEPTPDQEKPKKSPVKKKPKVAKSPTKMYVKKGYLSSDNQSTGSNRPAKNSVNDYTSPTKRVPENRPKRRNPQATKRTVDLKVQKNMSKENLTKVSKFDSPQMRHSATQKSSISKRSVGSESEFHIKNS